MEVRALLAASPLAGQWPLASDVPSSSLIVRFADGPGGSLAAGALASVGGYVEVTYPDGDSVVVLGRGIDRSAAVARLDANPDVVHAEADATVQASMVPNDPGFSGQWGLSQSSGIDIGAPAAWNVTTGSSQTIIAVIDTGIDLTSPEFAGRLWTNPADGSHGWNYVDDTNDPQDDNGHGTFVSGEIAATGNNGDGGAGINWHAQIMALKFLDSTGSGSVSDAVSAIDFAVANGARVINASWGSTGDDPALSDAIAYAGQHGVVFVGAAGNSGTDNDTSPFYPAAYHLSNEIAVAAIDQSGNLAGFSNYGVDTVDLAAPGENIEGLAIGGGTTYDSGTSMAAPFVTGVVSLIEGLYPSDTPAQIVSLIDSTATPLASLQGKTITGGLLDAPAALAAAAAMANAPHAGVSAEAGPITDNSSDDLGVAAIGATVTQTYIVTNTGASTLDLTGSISLPAGFTLAGDLGATTLAPGASTTFSVTVGSPLDGPLGGTISFATNDPEARTFAFSAILSVV